MRNRDEDTQGSDIFIKISIRKLWGKFFLHSKNRLLTVKRFPLLLKNCLFKICMRGYPLTVKRLSFQMLSVLKKSNDLCLKNEFSSFPNRVSVIVEL